MKKHNFLCVILAVLLLTLPISVLADEPVATEITIESAEQFLQFAEDCRLDSYSKDLSVKLSADIDLTGHSFSGIPVFCGKLDGNGHTISGISLTYTGSTSGLFRYLAEGAEISNLYVSGTFLPKGSAAVVGGIVGNNAGTVKNCTFSGTVSGTDHIGGIAGVNTETGVIEQCSAEGIVYGNHFAGGIVGSNHGIVKSSINHSLVNTQLQQNDVNLSDITLDALTGSELASTVTDIGGIAGISSGFISGCENHSDVGYNHIGYNIGGIAGTQTGYIFDCVNTGTISGRKEVGGIVGQLEPVIAITYSTDTLQILHQQLNTLSANVNQAANHVDSTVSGIKNQLVLIQGQVNDAVDAFEGLLPKEDDSAPSAEDLSQAVDTLQNTVTSIGGSLQSIYDYLQYADSALSRDMDNISHSLSAMEQTLNGAAEHLGGSLTDHSDADTEDDLTAKIDRCQNKGLIFADLNGGGIAGAIAFESDLDPEADIDIFGDATLNFAGAYRAVITGCKNDAPVSVKKQYAGGIVGYATLGLVRDCDNTANLNCADASYVGGIAGKSNGQIRSCNAKCIISAEKYAGGIAGKGSTVSDCLVLSRVSAGERAGEILGFGEDISLISHNLYMDTDHNLGAIDSISYDTAAQALSMEEFLRLQDLPEFFKTYTVTFEFPDQSTQIITLKTDEALTSEQIPQLPQLDGRKGTWDDLSQISFFDATVHSSYEARLQVVQADTLRENGLPVLLAEGSFLPQFHFEVSQKQDNLAPNAIEGWTFTNSGVSVLRYLPAAGYQPDDLCIMVQQEDETWKEIAHTVNGSYVVFSVDNGIQTFCVIPVENTPWGLYIATGAVLLTAVCIIPIVVTKRKKAGKQPAEHRHCCVSSNFTTK